MSLVANDGNRVRMRLDYRAELARSAARPTLHAGAIITAIDSAMGMAGMNFMQHSAGIATLDFRYDEFSAPPNEAGVFIDVHCERIDGDILYITGTCVDDAGEVRGRATGRFIRTAASTMPTQEQREAMQRLQAAQQSAQ